MRGIREIKFKYPPSTLYPSHWTFISEEENGALWEIRAVATDHCLPSPQETVNGYKNLLKIIFTDLSNIHQVGIFPSGGSIGGEDGSSISIWVIIYNLDGFIQSICLQNHKNWTKNLLFVTSHIWLPGVMYPEKKSVFYAYLLI